MSKARFLTFVLIPALVLAAPRGPVSAKKALSRSPNYAPGEVIVKLKAGAAELQLADQNERLMSIARMAGDKTGVVSDRSPEPLARLGSNKKVDDIIAQRGLDRTFVLKLDPAADVPSIVTELRARDDVEYAHANYFVATGSFIPNDPSFSQQWALLNTGFSVASFPATPNADIKAYLAWDTTLGSPNVIVAVSDSGFDLTHPDLVRNIYTNPAEIAGNGIDDDHNGYIDDVHGFNVAQNNGDTSDATGHGTEMAGVIAAEINNSIGIAGVCQSRIMPVSFYKRDGPGATQFSATISDAARSLIYAVAAGASIINASWRTLLFSDDVTAEDIRALEDAVKATNDAGVLLVCIAGNEGYNLDYSKIYPASYNLPNEIIVAASDYNDEIWHPPFNPYVIRTGYGPNTVHIAAPGVSVLTTQARGNCLGCTQSTDPNDWYTRADGTSISAAVVSGVAALVKSRYPADNAVALKKRIMNGAETVDLLRPYVINGGRVSAAGALTAGASFPTPALSDYGYKAKKEKLTVYGTNMQPGLTIIVGSSAYDANPRSGDGTVFVARVPASALPPGTPVPIKVRNPDGGQSQVLIVTR